MSNQLPMVSKKNQWLYNQVDCEFPTKESLAGLKLYRDSVEKRSTIELDVKALATEEVTMEHYLVDFHRLTIMFAILQSKRWHCEADQALLIEFLTQIILSAEHDLYVSFVAGEPVGAAIVTHRDEQLLLSDVVFNQHFELPGLEVYLSALIGKLTSEMQNVEKILIEI
ncbi:hypothetical protein LZU85_04165 [Vibrio sp. IRLE0018]|uniref:hypothetical protein n=1 Tax=Vibrio floridensis TaxID=2908007 RepID=UPI001F330288|nr:hypothetical protein [Vibrio floridensis]MCF8777987.1 hypothetical protein [Vibrio floridensis]